MENKVTQSQRLGEGVAPAPNASLQSISYNRDACAVGIVHLGIGAFHRAHQAVYTDDVLALSGGDWRILGVSLRSAGVRDQLNTQQGLYTLVEMDKAGTQYRLVGAISEVLVAPENPQAVLGAMVAESCRIVSLTITEKGYCHDPATGRLNKQHPDILHDLAQPDAPKSALGFIVEALRRRMQNNGSAPTVLCCDNLPSNGATLKQLVIEYACERDPALADWIDTQVPFPNTMVDRIVPATRPDDIEQLQKACGYQDLGMVKAERFSQWVIEDDFACGRPEWDKVGATLVTDVEPYELAKLRMLNGTHSALAYLGFLAGYEYVHEVVGNRDFYRFLRQLMVEEIAPTLVAPQGLDLTVYTDDLLERFANPSLMHRTYQIAMDGSQKLPQRLLGTLRDRLAADEGIERLSLAIAGWIRYVMAFDERGGDIAVQDPLAEVFQRIASDSYDAQDNMYRIDDLVNGFLSVVEVFGTELRQNSQFKARLTYWLGHLLANGAATTMKIFLSR